MPTGASPTTKRSRRWTSSTSPSAYSRQPDPLITKHFLPSLSRLAEGLDGADNVQTMRRLQVVPQELPLHPQDEVECRRCEVHCDKVVYPSACAERACPFLYAFEEFGHTYIGCMQRVYDVEIDVEMLHE